MKRLLRRFVCFMVGCRYGDWLSVCHGEPMVHAFLRQCRRCCAFEKRSFPARAPLPEVKS